MRRFLRRGLPLAFAGVLLPPLDSSPGLTSGFGEYRDGGRFHAGLDWSTGGVVGRPVRAVADGWVERVRASGVGYGRSLYLRLADGRTAVYGHLSKFAPALADWVAARQDSTGEYEQDLTPPPRAFAFRRGDVVAWSGDSGAGPPHLHLELRRGDMNLDPLRQGIRVTDHEAPAIAALTVTPVGARSRVAGGVDAWRGAWPRTGELAVPDVVGPFRLALDTWDTVTGRPNRLATWRLVAKVDGRVAFEAVLDSVSWDDMAASDRAYDLGATLAGMNDRRRLDRGGADRSGIVRRGAATFALAPGAHRLEFEATDEAGNHTRRAARVRVLAAPAPPTGPPGKSALFEEVLETGRPVARDRTVFVAAALMRGLVPVDSLAVAGGRIWMYEAPSPPPSRPGPSGVFFAGTGAGRVVLFDDLAGRVEMAWEEGAFHEPAALVASSARTAGPGSVLGNGLIVAGDAALSVSPRDLALARPVRLSMSGSPGFGARLGLFRRAGDSWTLVAAADSTGAIAATTRRLGTFAVLADTTAPEIVPPSSYVPRAGEAPPAFVARVRDAGAGLSAAAQRVLLDGRRVPAEYDPESDRLTWRPRAPLAPGAHVVTIEAVDALGNRSSVRVPVEVR